MTDIAFRSVEERDGSSSPTASTIFTIAVVAQMAARS
jgi:hypothetical protein